MLLYLNRLTDPARTFGKACKENLSVRILPELCDAKIRVRVQELVDEAVAASAFARERRNRSISHGDLALALGTSLDALPTVTRDKIDAAMSALHEVVRYISGELCDSDLAADPWYGSGGAKSLVRVLRHGLVAREERRKRLHEGEDLEPLPPL